MFQWALCSSVIFVSHCLNHSPFNLSERVLVFLVLSGKMLAILGPLHSLIEIIKSAIGISIEVALNFRLNLGITDAFKIVFYLLFKEDF